MVRRVRRARRDRWAGPPPLLLLATLLGVLVAPLVDHGPTASAVPGIRITAASPRAEEAPVPPQRTAGDPEPMRLAPVDIGVASFNMFQRLTPGQAAADARRLTDRSGVDIVGWQEAGGFVGELRALPGWTTRSFALGDQPSELAVSWRTERFGLVAARRYRVADGVSSVEGRYPFGARLVVVVTLRHRASGRLITVVNTHLPQKIEDLDAPGSWVLTINANRGRRQLGRIAEIWKRSRQGTVVGTGDYNFDAAADARVRPDGGPIQALRGIAVSSYQLLGRDVGPTHPPTGRNIDYVWVDAAQARQGRVELRSQGVMSGYSSDHRPIVVRMRLRD